MGLNEQPKLGRTYYTVYNGKRLCTEGGDDHGRKLRAYRKTDSTASEIEENVLIGTKDKTRSVVLFHDKATCDETIKALPGIIEKLQADGYKFDKLTTSTKPFCFE